MKKYSFLIIVILLIQTLAAQQDTIPLTLSDAVRIALSESPSIKIANQEIARVDYSEKSAWYALIPKIDASAQHTKFLVPAKMNMMGQVMDSPTDFNSSLGLSISLPLFAPALWHSIQMSSLEMQVAQEKAKASRINLQYEVSKAYYNVLVIQDSYNVLQKGYELAEQNFNVAKKGHEAGVIAAYDYISAEVQLNNLIPTLLQAQNGIKQAKTYLKVLMGIEIQTPIAILSKLSDFENKILELRSIDVLSLEDNSDLKQLDIQQKQLQKSLQLQRTQRIPTLAAFGQTGYSGTGNKETTLNFGGMPIAVEASKEWYSQGFVVGLQLNVPLTGIFTNTLKEKQISIQEKQLVLQRENAKNGLRLQALSALDNMNKAVKQVGAARKSVNLSEQAYTISSKRYENGAGTMIELQNATLAVTQSKLSFHQAISEYLTAKADLEKILGHEI
jgi:outer membrane protein TolC